MDPRVDLYKCRRRPWLAGLLSLFMPGLGQVYCGRFARGMVFALVFTIVIPALFALLAYASASLQNHYVLLMLPISVLLLLVWFLSIIDAVRLAKRTELIYELKNYNRWFVYLILFLILAYGLVGERDLILSKIVERWNIPTVSMFPALRTGDRLLVNNIIYNKNQPQIGDVVIFPCPMKPQESFCQRIVALGGDIVAIKDNFLYVNEQKLEREELYPAAVNDIFGELKGKVYSEKNGASQYKIFIIEAPANSVPYDYPQKQVPPRYCFVLGDNRSISVDSRQFGSIPLSSIKGKADYIYWPADDWARFGKLNNR
jgi:signal peptidase I